MDLCEKIADITVCIGFDGFVDQMIRVVERRENIDEFVPVKSVTQFGNIILASSGHSTLREIVCTAENAGGCAINTGDGLASLGTEVRFYGTVGSPVHRAFEGVTKRFAKIEDLGEPGKTLGKTLLLFGKFLQVSLYSYSF